MSVFPNKESRYEKKMVWGKMWSCDYCNRTFNGESNTPVPSNRPCEGMWEGGTLVVFLSFTAPLELCHWENILVQLSLNIASRFSDLLGLSLPDNLNTILITILINLIDSLSEAAGIPLDPVSPTHNPHHQVPISSHFYCHNSYTGGCTNKAD